ncbi:MAG TPA: serine hydrolase domain-containing protein [Nocardioidaceae bacterium]
MRELLQRCVDEGIVPGAVALVARGDDVEVAAAGCTGYETTTPLSRDSIFRIASISKPITAAAAMMLVDDGWLALDDPVQEWLPELASPMVVRTPASPLDDLVPARRPITLEDLLTFRAGYGFPSDFSLPAVGPLVTELGQGPPAPQTVPPPDAWMAALSGIPLLHQPGEAWLYNTCSDILGVLVARVSGRSLPDFLEERLFGPLGMVDTGFHVPVGKLHRLTSFYRPDPSGGVELADSAVGQWSTPPAFPSGAGGLVSTLDDWHAFARMLLAGGTVAGQRLLWPSSVRLMTSDHLTAAQRRASSLFLEGQGWGYGGSVDVARLDPWNVPGRYGWVGGTGTTAHVVPSTGQVAILLTQMQMTGPTPTPLMRDFWAYAADLRRVGERPR